MLAPYVGKWIAIRGLVGNVQTIIGDKTESMYLSTDYSFGAITADLGFDKSWAGRLQILNKHDEFAAYCQIDSFVTERMVATHCELTRVPH
jgi:hypothetical protein